MRITSGRFKGRRLVYPRAGLRPTKEITRQAIFNILAEEVQGARVCDLFAGGGALGLEAVSRGAKEVVFVEAEWVRLRYLRMNVAGIAGVRVLRGDVRRVGRRLAGSEFDIVFADPPYEQGLVADTLKVVTGYRLVRVDGWLVIEHSAGEAPETPGGWRRVKQVRYGESMVTFLRRCE